MKKAVSFLYFFFFSCLLFSVTAFAYIDPSAMTYIIQLIAGIAIAAGAGASYYLRRLRRKFSRHGKNSSHTAQYVDEDDDDDTGYGDYELDMPAQAQSAPFSAPAAEASGCVPQIHSFETRSAPAEPVYTGDAAAKPDPYDETGGTAGLIAENRELRRLLAEEQRKVEELKRALHICTAPKR